MTNNTNHKNIMDHKKHIIRKGIYNPPKNQFCNVKYMNFEPNVLKQIIGLNGNNLIDITKKSNCSYIWYNKKKLTIEFWSKTYKNTIIADRMLYHLIIKVIKYIIDSGHRVHYNTYQWFIHNYKKNY